MIFGAGELLVDAVLIRDGGGQRVHTVRGGGTVWNALVNAAAVGASCRGVGVAGDDWRASLAIADLRSLAVDPEVASDERRVTPTIFQLPDERQTLFDRGAWYLSPTCPVCDRKGWPSRHADLTLGKVKEFRLDQSSIFCVDRLSGGRTAAAEQARASGCGTVLDVGHRGFVRYMVAQHLAEALRLFDLIQAPGPVASTIAKRLGTDLPGLTVATGGATWIVTDGGNGLHVGSELGWVHVPAPQVVDVVDTTGAGDALLGTVLADLQRRGIRPSEASVEVVAEAAGSAGHVVAAALNAVGARGHLRPPPLQRPVTSITGSTVEQLRALQLCGGCILCGFEAPITRKARKVGASANLGWLYQRVSAATAAKDAVALAADWLEDTGTTVVCATGGSMPVAELVANLMNARGGAALVRYPAEYLAISPTVERVLAISYSGTNRDVTQVLEHATAAGVRRVGIVTMNVAPPIGDAGTLHRRVEVISYGRVSAKRERGFVSIAATVAPAAVWVTAAYDRELVLSAVTRPPLARRRFDDTAALLMDAAVHRQVVEVLATGWARPAALDLESKMTESASVVVRLHDTKDFSHGRFVSVLESNHARLLISVGSPTPYRDRLAEVLSADAGRFATLETKSAGAVGAFEALVAVQHLATLTAVFSGGDLSRPETIPQAGLELYKWEGDLP